MLKIAVLALFVVSCTCQQSDVIEVSGDRVVKTAERSLPVKTVSGVSSVRGISGFSALPVSQTIVGGVSPVVSSYGSYGTYGIDGLNTNLAYLRDLRSRVFGSSINIAPSPYSYLPFQSQSLAIRQPATAVTYAQPASYAVAQPAISGIAVSRPAIAVAQPAISIAQPAISIAQPAISVAQPALAVARPQLLAAQHQTAVHPVNAAITQVARTVEYRPIPFQDQPIVPQDVVVEPSDQPINIHFRSRSSTVRISQEHIPGEVGEVVQTQSQDEPSRVQHEVVKPVVQEVKEVIQPYRQVTQEIQPVVENVHTVVTHGEGQRQQYVAEPVVRQQLLSVRPAVQQLAVPAVQQVQHVQQVQPVYARHVGVAVAQPVVAARHVGVAVAQPAYASFQQVVPQVQTLAVPQLQSYQVAQPVVSSYVSQPQFLGVRSVGIAQPVVGVNRVVAVNQPGAVVRSEVREVRPEGLTVQRGSDYIRYAESV